MIINHRVSPNPLRSSDSVDIVVVINNIFALEKIRLKNPNLNLKKTRERAAVVAKGKRRFF